MKYSELCKLLENAGWLREQGAKHYIYSRDVKKLLYQGIRPTKFLKGL